MLLDKERYLLWGCRNLVIKTDAKYLFGMLNNPGKLPNATINHWVSEIRNFQFILVHKEGKTFGPDGLSRQRYYPGDKTTRNFDDGTDDKGEEFELEKATPETSDPLPLDNLGERILPAIDKFNPLDPAYKYNEEIRSPIAKKQDKQLPKIKDWLSWQGNYSAAELQDPEMLKLSRAVSHFYLDEEGWLYWRNGNMPQIVVDKAHHMYMMTGAHDCLGHQGIYATTKLVTQQFWWPNIVKDIAWFVRSCHICQVQQKVVLELPPVVTHTLSIFQVLHVDTMYIAPASNSCSYLVHS
ncbi:Pro-Pol polyprotein [Leucoagaricus sp. SymC.cos]|nr:Pro-Pol polyprotein [Leucoagaricus sp. SymC.cos]